MSNAHLSPENRAGKATTTDVLTLVPPDATGTAGTLAEVKHLHNYVLLLGSEAFAWLRP